MKCTEDCGYKAKPDNLDVIKAHVEECMRSGALRRLKKDPVILWKDGEFTVAEKALKKDRVFDVTFIKKEKMTLTEDLIKTPADYVTEPKVNPGGIEDFKKSEAKKKKNAKQFKKEKDS